MAKFQRPDDENYLLELLEDVYSSRAYSDVKIFHRNEEILLHKLVLSSASTFWAKILDHSCDDLVEIILDDSIPFEVYLSLFELIYKGTVTLTKEDKMKLHGKYFLMHLSKSGK